MKPRPPLAPPFGGGRREKPIPTLFRPYGADSHDFVGKDVALALGYDQTDKAIQRHVDEDDRMKCTVTDRLGRAQQAVAINESGLYALILSSKLPQAFQASVLWSCPPIKRMIPSNSTKKTPAFKASVLWSWRESNPRPNKETISFLHA